MRHARIALATLTTLAVGLVATPFANAQHADAPRARLIGRWEMTEEYGGRGCSNVDCLGPVPAGHRTTIEFANAGYTRTNPGGMPPAQGSWTIAAGRGGAFVLRMTWVIAGRPRPTDPQDVVFRDANTIEVRNAANHHGGVYHRL